MQAVARSARCSATRRPLGRSTRGRGRGSACRAGLAADAGEAVQSTHHEPLGEDGEGLYSRATKGCFDVIGNAWDLVSAAIDAAPAPAPGCPFVIADFGTADGGTSMPLLHRAIGRVRERFPGVEVEVRYEDQPFNEWRSLFFHTQGTVAIPDVPVYWRDYDGVFVTASGLTFAEQCFPSGSVHLAVSFTAMHWLSELPCTVEGAVHSTQASPEEKAKFQAQAAADWERILRHRAAELAPGGAAVLVNFTESPEGWRLGGTDEGANMYDLFASLWKRLEESGRITHEEFVRCTFPNHYRTEEEIRAPFAPGGVAAASGLELASVETRVVRCPFRTEYRRAGGDPVQYAADYVPTLRTWSNSTFLNALDDARPLAEREAIVEEFFASYRAEVAADPAAHGMDYVHSYSYIRKQA